jgi:glycerophosphoryl diester phosphodiesterase
VAWTVFSEQPTLIGHRGLGAGVVADYRENTLESFVAALDAGVRWVEVDVQRTRDNGLFVWHDASLDGRLMADMASTDAVELGAVRVEQLLEALPPTTGVVFDVKSSMRDAKRDSTATTATLLARACRATLKDRPAVAQSFDPAALVQMRQTLPAMALGLLTWMRFPIHIAIAAAAHLDVQVLAVHAGSLKVGATVGAHDMPSLEDIVAGVHHASRQFMVWCPSERMARRLTAAGADAMVVDDVPRHVQALRRRRR